MVIASVPTLLRCLLLITMNKETSVSGLILPVLTTLTQKVFAPKQDTIFALSDSTRFNRFEVIIILVVTECALNPRMLEMPSLDVNLRFENLITSEEDFTIMLSRKSTIFNGLQFVLMLKRSNSSFYQQ
jgi:hypothetical protein